MRYVHQTFPTHLVTDGEQVILFHINVSGHTSRDVYEYVAALKKWRFVRVSTGQDRFDAETQEAWLPGLVAVREANRNNEAAFSWLSTHKVCQHWSAYFASLPGALGANAT